MGSTDVCKESTLHLWRMKSFAEMCNSNYITQQLVFLKCWTRQSVGHVKVLDSLKCWTRLLNNSEFGVWGATVKYKSDGFLVFACKMS